jgi:hypothetical protein
MRILLYFVCIMLLSPLCVSAATFYLPDELYPYVVGSNVTIGEPFVFEDVPGLVRPIDQLPASGYDGVYIVFGPRVAAGVTENIVSITYGSYWQYNEVEIPLVVAGANSTILFLNAYDPYGDDNFVQDIVWSSPAPLPPVVVPDQDGVVRGFVQLPYDCATLAGSLAVMIFAVTWRG